MKKLLVLALIIFVKSAFAQKDTVGLNVPFVNNTVVYEKVFDVPTAPKNLLYSNAGLWFAETHPYVQDTQLQLVDPVLSRVVGRVKSYTVVVTDKVLWDTYYGNITYNFTLQVDCKDNKYRIRIYNIQDVLGNTYTPVDNLMFALISSKSYTLANAAVLKVPDLKQRFQALNTIVNNVIADLTKSMLVDNSF
ncbi:protein of unknown function [Mucilaginibacter mallensis]|uniref:DUF4468 domain-containing protein n=1 Tax=Mucilaginibacter mallensis TaxID=652787 RepID=A0A1H2BMJ4_MUCMA|nr:DUF4468 domain-containing protein [Mucilaginibacter mallensis]SDT59344.1 protein of unknown function [Mucilaginibacter mallensis]